MVALSRSHQAFIVSYFKISDLSGYLPFLPTLIVLLNSLSLSLPTLCFVCEGGLDLSTHPVPRYFHLHNCICKRSQCTPGAEECGSLGMFKSLSGRGRGAMVELTCSMHPQKEPPMDMLRGALVESKRSLHPQKEHPMDAVRGIMVEPMSSFCWGTDSF